jgi:hypothetical protein
MLVDQKDSKTKEDIIIMPLLVKFVCVTHLGL